MILTNTPKQKRISFVALSAAVLAVFWAVFAWIWPDNTVPEFVVSSITSLAMLWAGFVDWKYADDSEIFEG